VKVNLLLVNVKMPLRPLPKLVEAKEAFSKPPATEPKVASV
jgi:hypothetical protein